MKKLIAFLMALLLITTLMITISHADFGDYAGDSDFGGGDSGGGGYDGGGYDGGNDYYSGSSSSRNRSGDDSGSAIVAVIVIIIIIVVVALRIKNSKSSSANKPKYVNVGDRSTPESMLKPMDEYKNVDPGFNDADLKEKLSNLYVQMQNEWTNKNIESLRPYFADAMFTQMERQLEQMTAQGLTNYVTRISVQNVVLRGYMTDEKYDHIIAKIEARITDYTVKDDTGAVVSGSMNKEKFMVYEWDLTRTKGKKTEEAPKDELGRSVCPSCGAPLDINASARCEYCGSVISSSDHDWVISKITAVSQTTL